MPEATRTQPAEEPRALSPAERELARLANAHRAHLEKIEGHRARVARLREELVPEASAQSALNAVAAAEAADLAAWTEGELPKPRDEERAAAEATLRAATQRANAARSAIAKARAEIASVERAIEGLSAERELAVAHLLEEKQAPALERLREAVEAMLAAERAALAIHAAAIDRAHALPDGHPVKQDTFRRAEAFSYQLRAHLEAASTRASRLDIAAPLSELAASIARAGDQP